MNCFFCLAYRGNDAEIGRVVEVDNVNVNVDVGSAGWKKNNKGESRAAAISFSFRELAWATRGFKEVNLIGEGGFGRVYKGRLSTGQACIVPCSCCVTNSINTLFYFFSVMFITLTGLCCVVLCCLFSILQVVAVKQLNHDGHQGFQEFVTEVLMLSLLHHSNLVNLIGYCTDGDQRLLVYEYMPMGSLEHHLFGNHKTLYYSLSLSLTMILMSEWLGCVALLGLGIHSFSFKIYLSLSLSLILSLAKINDVSWRYFCFQILSQRKDQ